MVIVTMCKMGFIRSEDTWANGVVEVQGSLGQPHHLTVLKQMLKRPLVPVSCFFSWQ